MTTPDNPSKSEVWGQFHTLSARLDNLDGHVVDALNGSGGSHPASAILWIPSGSLTPDVGDPVSMVWYWPAVSRPPVNGLASPWWVAETWTLPPVWVVDPDDYVLLLLGEDSIPSVYAKVTPTGFEPITLNGGEIVSVSCATYDGTQVWVGSNFENPATGGTLVTEPATNFLALSMMSDSVYLKDGYTGSLSGRYTAEAAFDVLDGLNPDALNTDLIPGLDNEYTLGNEQFRWKSVSVGGGTIYITDGVTGDQVGLTISDGVFFLDGIAQAQLPVLVVTTLVFDDGNEQSHSSDVLLVSHLDGNQSPPETVDFTKQVLVMSDGTWLLPDGVEGQVAHFAQGNGGSAEDSYLQVAHLRHNVNGLATQVNNALWSPFSYENGVTHNNFSVCTAIFTDGHWAFSAGRIR